MSADADGPGQRQLDAATFRRGADDADARLAPLLGGLNAASTQAEVGSVVATQAALLWDARGAAVGLVDGATLRLVASVGYDCATMAAGARLPMSAGLPITEAARGGQLTVHRGAEGAGWVAVPIPGAAARPAGALLLSLRLRPVAVDIPLITEIARHTSRALTRVGSVAGAPPVPATRTGVTDLDIATHRAGVSGLSSGDVVDVMSDGGGGCIVVVADVCGSDLEAARVARDVQLLSRALAPVAGGPAALLRRIDEVLREGLTDRFVTALAVHVQPLPGTEWAVTVASAGHPQPLLLRSGTTDDIGQSDLPLNLETADVTAARHEFRALLRSGDVLLLATDGLTDRVRGFVSDSELAAAAHASVGAMLTSADRLAHLLRDVDGLHGPSRDDLAAVVISVP